VAKEEELEEDFRSKYSEDAFLNLVLFSRYGSICTGCGFLGGLSRTAVVRTGGVVNTALYNIMKLPSNTALGQLEILG
jgi:hypothetical protein